jgi:hypothetical protein
VLVVKSHPNPSHIVRDSQKLAIMKLLLPSVDCLVGIVISAIICIIVLAIVEGSVILDVVQFLTQEK